MDHKHILALVEAIHGADLDAIHVFALDAVFDDDIGHGHFPSRANAASAARPLHGPMPGVMENNSRSPSRLVLSHRIARNRERRHGPKLHGISKIPDTRLRPRDTLTTPECSTRSITCGCFALAGLGFSGVGPNSPRIFTFFAKIAVRGMFKFSK